MSNELIDSQHRMIGGKYSELIDPSLFGDALDYYNDLKEKGTIYRGLGFELIENRKSSIVLTGPHSQLGLIVNLSEEAYLVDENSQKPTDIPELPRISKSTVKPAFDENNQLIRIPVRDSAKKFSGMGDTLSKVMIYEIARELAHLGELPNIANPTYTQADAEPNSGKKLSELPYLEKNGIDKSQIKNVRFGDNPKKIKSNPRLSDNQSKLEYWAMGAARLSAKMIQNFRYGISNLLTSNLHRSPLVLNIHTAFNRKEENRLKRSQEDIASYGPEKPINVVIGSTRGLSITDYMVEINLARFLESKGFGVVVTSFFSPPKIADEEEPEDTDVKAKPAYRGEKASSKRIRKFFKENNIDPNEFQRDKVIESKGRLRGTEFMRALRDYVTQQTKNSKQPNIIQLEITMDTLKNREQRQKLAKAIAEFCSIYDNKQKNEG